jgi:hypothetical protein
MLMDSHTQLKQVIGAAASSLAVPVADHRGTWSSTCLHNGAHSSKASMCVLLSALASTTVNLFSPLP